VIRPASAADAVQIAAVRRDSWIAAYEGIIPRPVIDRATTPDDGAPGPADRAGHRDLGDRRGGGGAAARSRTSSYRCSAGPPRAGCVAEVAIHDRPAPAGRPEASTPGPAG
jgi:hypothetical protein